MFFPCSFVFVLFCAFSSASAYSFQSCILYNRVIGIGLLLSPSLYRLRLTHFILPFAFRSLSTFSPDKIEKRTNDAFVSYSLTRIQTWILTWMRIRFLILYKFRIWVRFWVLAFWFLVSVSVSVCHLFEAFPFFVFTFLCCLLCFALRLGESESCVAV